MVDIDLVLLSRDLSPPRDDVWRGIASQTGVRPRVHRVAGPPRPEDVHRWETIARARNQAKRCGTTPWVFFLDDDVVLAPDCASKLLDALRGRPVFAALGADYDNEMANRYYHWDYPPHVGMGAVLFRRDRLAKINFRWADNRCECGCCCDDLRKAGHAIGYLPGARAIHRHHSVRLENATGSSPLARQGRVLTAFNSAHFGLFIRQFLRTFRGSGNTEAVTAVAYDLPASEQREIAALPGVELLAKRSSGLSPAALRIRDFAEAIADWPEDTPAAYWDAGDVLFQDRIDPLWQLVRENPDRVLATREHTTFLNNPGAKNWVETIRDPRSRTRLLALLSNRPILNGGFLAGTTKALRSYFSEAQRIRSSVALRGSSDWGDQTTLNVYCHSKPEAWKEIEWGWNYCLYGRGFRNGPGGKIESLDGTPVHVVHGNAGSLRDRPLQSLLTHRRESTIVEQRQAR